MYLVLSNVIFWFLILVGSSVIAPSPSSTKSDTVYPLKPIRPYIAEKNLSLDVDQFEGRVFFQFNVLLNTVILKPPYYLEFQNQIVAVLKQLQL